MGGLMWVTGNPGEGPMRAGVAIADSSAGLYATIGILIALTERERSGVGQWVQTSLLQSQIAMMDFQAARYLVEGEVPGQAGNEHPYSTPMGVLNTADGFVNIGVGGDSQWRALCKALERPDLAASPDYQTVADRFRNRPKLMELLNSIFKTQTSAEWLKRLEAVGVPAGPIYKMDEVFSDPQVQHLGIAVSARHPGRGDIKIVGQPVELSRTPSCIVSMIPESGGNTDEILHELGFADAEIQRLRNAKVV
jgi:crotonobetainyl-CoA:carnitine CoA-transferase CaiB-like acyl-CoA transferase